MNLTDEQLDWIEDHRLLIALIGVVIIAIIIGICIHNANVKKKSEAEAAEQARIEQEEAEEAARLAALEQDQVEPEQPIDSYRHKLGLDGDYATEERVEVVEQDGTEIEVKPETTKRAKYDTTVIIYDHTGVPQTNVDGSSCLTYMEGVTLDNFGSYWGTALTEDDFNGNQRYLVGVSQNRDDFLKGDLQSVGWLIDNLGSLEPNDCIKFTDLHVIGDLSDSHVAMLCSSDWYSAFGLKDTLLVFEDISGSLKTSDFSDGDTFSATVFVHNIKIEPDVNGQRVVCLEYATFE